MEIWFTNYIKALRRLNEAVELLNKSFIDVVANQGIIHTFQYVYETFNVMQGYLKEGCYNKISKRYFYQLLKQLIENQVWLEMIKSRKNGTYL